MMPSYILQTQPLPLINLSLSTLEKTPSQPSTFAYPEPEKPLFFSDIALLSPLELNLSPKQETEAEQFSNHIRDYSLIPPPLGTISKHSINFTEEDYTDLSTLLNSSEINRLLIETRASLTTYEVAVSTKGKYDISKHREDFFFKIHELSTLVKNICTDAPEPLIQLTEILSASVQNRSLQFLRGEAGEKKLDVCIKFLNMIEHTQEIFQLNKEVEKAETEIETAHDLSLIQKIRNKITYTKNKIVEKIFSLGSTINSIINFIVSSLTTGLPLLFQLSLPILQILKFVSNIFAVATGGITGIIASYNLFKNVNTILQIDKELALRRDDLKIATSVLLPGQSEELKAVEFFHDENEPVKKRTALDPLARRLTEARINNLTHQRENALVEITNNTITIVTTAAALTMAALTFAGIAFPPLLIGSIVLTSLAIVGYYGYYAYTKRHQIELLLRKIDQWDFEKGLGLKSKFKTLSERINTLLRNLPLATSEAKINSTIEQIKAVYDNQSYDIRIELEKLYLERINATKAEDKKLLVKKDRLEKELQLLHESKNSLISSLENKRINHLKVLEEQQNENETQINSVAHARFLSLQTYERKKQQLENKAMALSLKMPVKEFLELKFELSQKLRNDSAYYERLFDLFGSKVENIPDELKPAEILQWIITPA